MSTSTDSIALVAEPASGSATSLQPVPPSARHDGWTPAKQARFLRELASSHCVSTAVRAVGMTRQSAYKLRNRLKGEPFDVAWRAAFRRQYEALAEAAVERAINGVEVPHFYKGELIHVSRRYDERAAVALLSLRDRLAPFPRCREAEDERLEADDFDTLVARVKYGPATWAAWGKRVESAEACEAEGENDNGDEAEDAECRDAAE